MSDAISEVEVEALFADVNMIDLYTAIVRRSTEWPTLDFSIKTLAKFLGFNWRDTEPSGAASIEWYHRWVDTGDAALKTRLLDYNEDDCRATRVLLDVWPFNFSGVGRGDLAIGRASYAARIEHFVNGWPQDGQQAARLGLADEAASIVLAKSRNTNKCPALPKTWSGKFRLHAAHNTTVTASLKDGAVEWMTVDPSSRAKDVEFGEGWSLR